MKITTWRRPCVSFYDRAAKDLDADWVETTRGDFDAGTGECGGQGC